MKLLKYNEFIKESLIQGFTDIEISWMKNVLNNANTVNITNTNIANWDKGDQPDNINIDFNYTINGKEIKVKFIDSCSIGGTIDIDATNSEDGVTKIHAESIGHTNPTFKTLVNMLTKKIGITKEII